MHWVGIAIPMILIYVVWWIPQINGPHLWFGLPSLFVWFCLVSGPLVSLTLWWFESKRTDAEEKETDAPRTDHRPARDAGRRDHRRHRP